MGARDVGRERRRHRQRNGTRKELRAGRVVRVSTILPCERVADEIGVVRGLVEQTLPGWFKAGKWF